MMVDTSHLALCRYGAVSECLSARVPLVYVRRDHFNEEPFLRRLLARHDAAVEIKKADLMSGNWAVYLEEALRHEVTYERPTDGAEVAAQHIADYALHTDRASTREAPTMQVQPPESAL